MQHFLEPSLGDDRVPVLCRLCEYPEDPLLGIRGIAPSVMQFMPAGAQEYFGILSLLDLFLRHAAGYAARAVVFVWFTVMLMRPMASHAIAVQAMIVRTIVVRAMIMHASLKCAMFLPAMSMSVMSVRSAIMHASFIRIMLLSVMSVRAAMSEMSVLQVVPVLV